MSLVLIVDLCLCNLSGGLLSLKGTGELEGELKLIGESFEMVDDVLLALGSGLRSMVIVVLEFRQILLHVVDHRVPGQRSKLAGCFPQVEDKVIAHQQYWYVS